MGARLLLEVLPRWSKGEITPQAQNDAEATYCSPISKEKGEIDWHLPALDIWRQVRAFQPWPGCYTTWRGRQLKIIEAVPLPEEKGLAVGQVVALTPPKEGAVFGICTGSGVLGILKIQLTGKQAMSAAEFLRGQRQFLEAVLPSG
jgi:methionyl-tRNA formyltransferase